MPTTPTSNRVRIDVLAGHRDARGVVFEPLSAADIAKYRNVHVVISEPGAVRGNHHHVRGTEITTVVGPVWVRYREADTVHDVQVPDGEVWRFAFSPGVSHAFKNTGDKAFVLVSFNTEEHDQTTPDAVRELLIEA